MDANEFQKFLRAVNCMGDLDFVDMYVALGFKPSYAMEKFRIMRTNFCAWACNMDENTLNKVIDWVKNNRY